MRWKPTRVPTLVLVILTVVSLVFVFLLERSKAPREAPLHEEKLRAATLSQEGLRVLKERRLELGIPIDLVNDPGGTGLIGHQFSLITVERGELTSNLTAVNPNFSALMVQILDEMGLTEGDVLGVGWTGSHPALNVALMAACKVLSVRPVIVTSLGSAMWGANDPQYTWLDMEAVLKERGLFDFTSIAASIGGDEDVGRGLSPEGIALLEEAMIRNGIPEIKELTLTESVERRLSLFREHDVSAYVNIGRGDASLGPPEIAGLFRQGVTERFRRRETQRTGVILEMAVEGKPVANISEVEEIALGFSLPLAPREVPKPGEGRLFVEYRYSVVLAILFAVLLSIFLFVFVRIDVSRHLLKTKE
jgi:poly-gamma-glutamate system protein